MESFLHFLFYEYQIDVRQSILRCVGFVIPKHVKTHFFLKLLPIFCKVDESGNLQKTVKISSVKEIY